MSYHIKTFLKGFFVVVGFILAYAAVGFVLALPVLFYVEDKGLTVVTCILGPIVLFLVGTLFYEIGAFINDDD